MASLYIKSPRAAELATDLARRLGQSKTQVVVEALEARVRAVTPDIDRPRKFSERLAKWRHDNPLPPFSGLAADKAFYDSLYE